MLMEKEAMLFPFNQGGSFYLSPSNFGESGVFNVKEIFDDKKYKIDNNGIRLEIVNNDVKIFLFTRCERQGCLDE